MQKSNRNGIILERSGIMPKIGHLINKLTVGDRVYNSPEVWNSAHKLKKFAKKEEFLRNIRANARFISCEVHNLQENNYVGIVNQMHGKLDEIRYSQFAPWNPAFRKSKTIVIV